MDPISSGDLVASDPLNTAFDSMVASINAITNNNMIPHQLGRQHLPGLVQSFAYASLETSTKHTYDSSLYPYPGRSSTAVAWCVINENGDAGGGTEVSAVFDAWVDILDDTFCKGIYIRANVELIEILRSAAGTTAQVWTNAAVFALQVRDENGDWYHVARSERIVQQEEDPVTAGDYKPSYLDVPLFMFFTAEDAGYLLINQVSAVRVVVSVQDSDSMVPNIYVKCRRASIMAFAVYSGDI